MSGSNLPSIPSPVIANANPSVSSNLNSGVASTTLGTIAATSGDGAGSAKAGAFSPPAPAVGPAASAGDKKSASVPANSSNQASAPAPLDAPLQNVVATFTAATPVASLPPSPGRSDSTTELPQTHQMLDSPLPVPPPVATASAVVVPGSMADLAMNAEVNAQMHVGFRTDAFGSVEIHTVVQQSQIGITVHADRDIARWFTAEVPGLESELSKSHLNLTAVDFENGRSGMQTSTGSQQEESRQGFSQATGGSSAARSESPASTEPSMVSVPLFDVSPGALSTRVSFHA